MTSQVNCLVCNNPTWTWYEVLGAVCGDEKSLISKLCETHRDSIIQQLKDVIAK